MTPALLRPVVSGALLLAAASANAACELDIEATDAMSFSDTELTVDAGCETVSVTLTHTGSMARNVMGHNWVLTETADFDAVAQAGMAAGLDNEYVPVDDERVIAATRVLGGGESQTISFAGSRLEAGGEYSFMCSFPGHWAIMRGTLAVAESGT